MSQWMNPRTKVILMNCAVAVALIYKRWKGAPVAVVLIVGIFMFTLVNVIMFFAARKSASRSNDS
jgi:energy-coupling factor transporter transmembrane protein EcfT